MVGFEEDSFCWLLGILVRLVGLLVGVKVLPASTVRAPISKTSSNIILKFLARSYSGSTSPHESS